MNKNSIEEDIKILEEDIKILEELRTHGYAMLLMKYEDRIKTNRKIDQALEHIVSDHKRVLKENEELRTEVNSLKGKLKEENELNKIIKDTKLDELFCTRNGKEVKQAIKLRDELLKLPECKLYGIKKCKKSVILITKEEVIPVKEAKDLKDRILKNKEYTVVLEGDKEFPDNATEATFEKYINLKVLDELVERK